MEEMKMPGELFDFVMGAWEAAYSDTHTAEQDFAQLPKERLDTIISLELHRGWMTAIQEMIEEKVPGAYLMVPEYQVIDVFRKGVEDYLDLVLYGPPVEVEDVNAWWTRVYGDINDKFGSLITGIRPKIVRREDEEDTGGSAEGDQGEG